MHVILIAMAGGAAAFTHCLGMCGPFALHLSGGGSGRRVLANQLMWHLGKLTTYVFLGALAGFAGGILTSTHWPWVQDALAYAAGGAMILMGLALLGVRPLPKAWTSRTGPGVRDAQSPPGAPADDGIIAPLFRQFFGRPTPMGAGVLGLATGFLPCPVVMAFLALSARQGSVLAGMGVMAAMGIGTAWSLLALGLAGGAMRIPLRRWGQVVGGVIVLLMGVFTVLRGTEAFHGLLGCPHGGASAAATAATSPCGSDANSAPPCCGGHTPR